VQLTDGGQLSEPVRPTEPGDYDADLAPKKSRLGLVIGVAAAAAIALAAGGAALWFVVLAPEETVEVAATDAPGESPTANANPPTEPEGVEATPGADPTSDSVVPDPGEAPAEGSEDDEVGADGDEGEDAEGEAGEDEDADEEGDDSASSAPGEVVPRAELEGFELALPTLARRARRMPRPQRTRTARTLRAQAIRAYRADDFAEAERLYREAMTYETWDVAAAEGAARSIAQQRRLPEALAWANLAVERNPRSGAAYRVLGDVWRQAGHPDEAARAYRRGLARRPADRWLRQRLRDVRAER
jgi:tetratricopeptide (TPR) repeat protein